VLYLHALELACCTGCATYPVILCDASGRTCEWAQAVAVSFQCLVTNNVPNCTRAQCALGNECATCRYLAHGELIWTAIDVWEVGQQGARHGPYRLDRAALQCLAPALSGPGGSQEFTQLPKANEVFSHWVYACTK
jgi:hypothetical protein